VCVECEEEFEKAVSNCTVQLVQVFFVPAVRLEVMPGKVSTHSGGTEWSVMTKTEQGPEHSSETHPPVSNFLPSLQELLKMSAY